MARPVRQHATRRCVPRKWTLAAGAGSAPYYPMREDCAPETSFRPNRAGSIQLAASRERVDPSGSSQPEAAFASSRQTSVIAEAEENSTRPRRALALAKLGDQNNPHTGHPGASSA